MNQQNKFPIKLLPTTFEAILFQLQETVGKMRNEGNEYETGYLPTYNGGLVPVREVYLRLNIKLSQASMKPKETTLTLNFEEAKMFAETVTKMSPAEQGALGIMNPNQTLLKTLC